MPSSSKRHRQSSDKKLGSQRKSGRNSQRGATRSSSARRSGKSGHGRARRSNAKKRAEEIVFRLAKEYPEAKTALRYRNPFEMLIATVLSAQCTDAKVNEVTPVLFERYPEPDDLAGAELGEVEAIIRPTGFYRNKAKTLAALSSKLVEEFGGKVPERMDDLVRLPGVGRKTAAVVQSTALKDRFPDGPEGIAVDTHVFRLSKRLGLSRNDDPEKVERDLMEIFPRSVWGDIALRLILHGRKVCKARKPACDLCVLADICPSAGIFD
jgi:endonuclease-3